MIIEYRMDELMRKCKIGLWGQLGGKNPADGQAIKTIYVLNKIKDRYGLKNVKHVNTNQWKKRPLRVLLKTTNLFFRSNVIIIMPANNGLRVISKLYNFLLLFKKAKIVYFVIGGFLPKFVDENPRYKKIFIKYEMLFVETKNMKSSLIERGISNVSLIPNFKIIKRINPELLKTFEQGSTIKLCTFSRVTASKGIIEAIDAVVSMNDDKNPRYFLDIYGMIDIEFESEFNKKIAPYSSFVKYKGIAPFNEATQILSDYFALLFPTYYHGEGFAGCLIDAFYSGLPIVATDWLYNSEIVKDGYNGYLCTPRSAKSIRDCIIKLESNLPHYMTIKMNNYNESFKYDADIALKPLFETIENGSINRKKGQGA